MNAKIMWEYFGSVDMEIMYFVRAFLKVAMAVLNTASWEIMV